MKFAINGKVVDREGVYSRCKNAYEDLITTLNEAGYTDLSKNGVVRVRQPRTMPYRGFTEREVPVAAINVDCYDRERVVALVNEVASRNHITTTRPDRMNNARGDIFLFLNLKKSDLIEDHKQDANHTMDELYDYRMAYNAMAFNDMAKDTDIVVEKSWRHNDGELCFGGGWFVVTALLPTGQVTNHYPGNTWGYFKIPVVERAMEWDGHDPKVALDRLKQYILSQ